MKYARGICPECGRCVAGSIYGGNDVVFSRDVREFRDSGLCVEVATSANVSVTLRRHRKECPRAARIKSESTPAGQKELP